MSSERDKKSSSSKLRTLSDLNRPPLHNSGNDPDSDAPQEYYTDGEKSGMIVQEPKYRNEVNSIFKSGAVLWPPENPSSPRFVTGAEPESIVHNIVFWGNGFTVNGGPLRRLDDPENVSFFESIKRSECPKELERTVILALDRRIEDYTEWAEHLAVAPQSTDVTYTSTDPPRPLQSARQPSMGLVVDKSQSSTLIQLRLSDGTRMVARFNHHHNVGEIRAFIDASQPGGSRTYQLQVAEFPPTILTDLT